MQPQKALAVSQDDRRLAVAYVDGDGALKLARRTNDSGFAASVTAVESGVTTIASAALTPDDRVVVVYSSVNPPVRHSRVEVAPDGSASTPAPLSVDDSYAPDMRALPDGRVLLVWGTLGLPRYSIRGVDGSWSGELTLQPASDSSDGVTPPSIAVDAAGAWITFGTRSGREVALQAVRVAEGAAPGPPEIALRWTTDRLGNIAMLLARRDVVTISDGAEWFSGVAFETLSDGGGRATLLAARRGAEGGYGAVQQLDQGSANRASAASDSRGGYAVMWHRDDTHELLFATAGPAADTLGTAVKVVENPPLTQVPDPRLVPAGDGIGGVLDLISGGQLGTFFHRVEDAGAINAPQVLSTTGQLPVVVGRRGGMAFSLGLEANTSRPVLMALDAVAPSVTALDVPSVGSVGDPVTMRADATDVWSAPVTLTWRFDDGSTVVGAEARHVWSSPGVKTVTLAAADTRGNRVERTAVVTVAGSAGGPPPPPPDRKAPVVAKLRASGATVRFSLSEPASVRVSARRVCARGVRRCRGRVRFTKRFTRAGAHKVSLAGRRLPRGTYRVTVTPTDRAGNRGRSSSVRVKLTRR